MKVIKILILLILCFSLQGCPYETFEEPEIKFEIINSSTTDIYSTGSHNAGEIVIIEPVEGDKIAVNGIKTDRTFNIFFEEGRLLTIFIYKESTLNTYTWQEIEDQELYDKRYDLTLEELKALNFQIVYTEG